MEESIFTKIVRGEIPSHKIYEDERVLAFLDIHPVSTGHALVIPKHQVEFLWDLEDDDYQAVMTATRAIARRMRDVLGVKYVGVKVIGVDVPHAHLQLVPFNTTAEYQKPQDMESEPNHAELAATAEKLRF